MCIIGKERKKEVLFTPPIRPFAVHLIATAVRPVIGRKNAKGVCCQRHSASLAATNNGSFTVDTDNNAAH